MGMFDYVYYDGKEYQSKDTPNQLCDKYKIEEEQETGRLYLWREAYKAKWVNDDSTPLGHRLETWDHHWIHCDDFDGLPIDETCFEFQFCLCFDAASKE